MFEIIVSDQKVDFTTPVSFKVKLLFFQAAVLNFYYSQVFKSKTRLRFIFHCTSSFKFNRRLNWFNDVFVTQFSFVSCRC